MAHDNWAKRQTSRIKKVVNCENTFGALSENGEVFVFGLDNPTSSIAQQQQEIDAAQMVKQGVTVRPQRVWALRKQFSAVKVRTCPICFNKFVKTQLLNIFY